MNHRRAAARRWLPSLAAAACLAVSPVVARTQDSLVSEAPGDTTIAAPVGFVNDRAGVLDGSTRAKLESFLDRLKRATGAEFAVLIVPTTAPEDPTTYKVRVFERWGLGARGKDEGLLLLVAIAEREARFETGYGLEGVLPDGLQSRIFREQMAPSFRNGDYATGIVQGVLAVSERIAREKGVTLEWDGRELRYDETPSGRGPPFWALVLGFVIVWIILSSLGGGGRGRRRRGGWMNSGGWGGGFGGWGGGGFGGGIGGGGGFGGGGGSFGGFGGGASGGGGGGGKW